MPRKTMTYGDILGAGPKVRYWAIEYLPEYASNDMPIGVGKVRFDETAWKKLESGDETEFVCRWVEHGEFVYLTAEQLYGSEDEARDEYALRAVRGIEKIVQDLAMEVRFDFADKLDAIRASLIKVADEMEKERDET